MNIPYDKRYTPPAPVLNVRLASLDEKPSPESYLAQIDTGADGTLIPLYLLEEIEAVEFGDAVLHGVLGESKEVHLYEVDLHIESFVLKSVVVIGDEYGDQILLGRNVLNKMVLLLDGQSNLTKVLEQRPKRLRDE
ncbi:MAG: hypothetical protein HZC38_14855 [Chloroflexi bacterium]|nr:hypothetical protein [Chloroflexota bacterium]